MSQQFYQTSYALHEQSYSKNSNDEELALYKNWFDNNTTDVWRHVRMLDNIKPFLQQFPKAKWLTVGDGRFGTSAIYINKNKGNAMPTDIDISLLEIAKQNNWIPDYKYANAEALPFDNDSFDFSFCKESYHHFPRAFIGIYEMLRVSKKAVILTEPSDWLPSPIPRRIVQIVKNRLKSILNISSPHPDTGNYEEIGNYVFTISTREIQKIALGLQLPAIAYKTFHDEYIKGVEYEKISDNAPLYRSIQGKLKKQKILRALGLSSYNRISVIIFKEYPTEAIRKELSNIGFNIIDLPKNPYIV